MTRIGEEQSAVERVIQAWSDKWESVRFCDDALKDLVSILAVPASEEVERVAEQLDDMLGYRPFTEFCSGYASDVQQAASMLRRLDAERTNFRDRAALLNARNAGLTDNVATLTAELATLRAVPQAEAVAKELATKWWGRFVGLQSSTELENDIRAALVRPSAAAADEVAAERDRLRAALGKIARGEVEDFDEETEGAVTVAMTGEEAAEIARAALRGADKDDTAGKGR